MGEYAEMAREEEMLRAFDRRLAARLDWHTQRAKDEPPCGPRQWRTRDRTIVLSISAMTDVHLGHSIRFASTMRQHESRLGALLYERALRSGPITLS